MVEIASQGVLPAAKIGVVVAADAQGLPAVDFDGNPHGPVPARVAVATAVDCGANVVLVFEDGDAAKPIIVGVLQRGAAQDDSNDSNPRRLELSAPQVSISASEQLEIRCGEGTLQLRADGKVLLRGTDVTSRAKRTNKVKGGSVQIN